MSRAGPESADMPKVAATPESQPGHAMSTAPLIDMRNTGKSFGGVPVLTGVDFRVARGEVVSLLGANGAGKSTLMKILTGNYLSDTGSIHVDGRTTSIREPADALRLGIRLLPQELSIFADLNVAENIMMGNLPRQSTLGVPRVDRSSMLRSASELLARLGLERIAVRRRMGSLSHHEQRIVEIARALAGNARLLVMDEPSAALADTEVQTLFTIIGRLKAEGVSVVYISHYLDEVFEVSDRIVVLRDGRNAGDLDTHKTDEATVLEAIVGSRVGNIYPAAAGNAETVKPIADITGLSVPGWLDAVSFQVNAGQILGMHGLVGSGMEMVGRALFGAVPTATAETIELDGKPYRIGNTGDAVAAGLGLVAAERKREGIIAMLSVRENLSVSNMDVLAKGATVNRQREQTVVADWIARLAIRTRNSEQVIGTLSGGNQQKVCLARWLIGELKILILEEPTRGVDMGARQEIYRQIRQLANAGLAIVVISSDAEEVAGLSDRSVVLAQGRVVEQHETPATAATLMAAASHTGRAA